MGTLPWKFACDSVLFSWGKPPRYTGSVAVLPDWRLSRLVSLSSQLWLVVWSLTFPFTLSIYISLNVTLIE